MHVNKTFKNPTQAHLVIDATAEDLAPIKRHVLGHFVRSTKVPGFRAGKAPLHLVEKNIDQKRLLDEFLEHAVNELYGKAINNEKIRPVGTPNVEIKRFVPYTDLGFEVTADVIGEIKLANYKTIKLAKKPVSVTAKDITDVITGLRQRTAEREDVTRAAKNGDELTIDFAGKDSNAKAVPGADGKDYPLILGSKTFIPGFEEHLVGLKAGEKKEFTITFPGDYGVEALQGQKVTFSVEVKKVSELKEPKADDEFASKVGPFKTLAELKADIKKQLANDRQTQADRDYENELIGTIAEQSDVEVPDTLIDGQLQQMEEEEKRNLVYRGQTWQEHLEAEGVTEEQHRERQRPDAEKRVKAGLVLSEIAEQEQLSVEPEELELRIQALKGQYKDDAMQMELDKPENQQDIAARMLTEKTIAKLTDYASK
jgi:trigger factor